MKLYKTTTTRTANEADVDNGVRWSGSQADAATDRKTFVSAGFKRVEVDTVEVDVPTDKKGLLAFLNAGA